MYIIFSSRYFRLILFFVCFCFNFFSFRFVYVFVTFVYYISFIISNSIRWSLDIYVLTRSFAHINFLSPFFVFSSHRMNESKTKAILNTNRINWNGTLTPIWSYWRCWQSVGKSLERVLSVCVLHLAWFWLFQSLSNKRTQWIWFLDPF